jgi:hypothetical protein
VDLSHEILFSLSVDLEQARAVEFVRDVPRSLRKADFLAELQVVTSRPPVVSAAIPVSAALFGQRELPFRSELHETEFGARLVPVAFDYDGPGWADVSGEATVSPAGAGSRLDYTFHITVHVRLPESDHWGAQALVKMIEYTARTVLHKVMNRLPAAVAAAAALEAGAVLESAAAAP